MAIQTVQLTPRSNNVSAQTSRRNLVPSTEPAELDVSVFPELIHFAELNHYSRMTGEEASLEPRASPQTLTGRGLEFSIWRGMQADIR
jgi:hypothetical protein